MKSNVIQTYSGQMVDVTGPATWRPCLADIAVPLSRLARFGGHTRERYSVARHSVICSLIVDRFVDGEAGADRDYLVLACQRWALLHDAHEAFLGDIPAPLKRLAEDLVGNAYRWDAVIAEWAGVKLNARIIDAVKLADLTMLSLEKRDLLNAECVWPEAVLPPPLADVRLRGSAAMTGDRDDWALFVTRWDELYSSDVVMRGTPALLNASTQLMAGVQFSGALLPFGGDGGGATVIASIASAASSIDSLADASGSDKASVNG